MKKTAPLKLVADSQPKTPEDDLTTRYVRVRSTSREGYVEFDFAIGDPNLFVELILPAEAFKSFCENNNVVHMSDAEAEKVDAEMEKWRYGEKGRNPGSAEDDH